MLTSQWFSRVTPSRLITSAETFVGNLNSQMSSSPGSWSSGMNLRGIRWPSLIWSSSPPTQTDFESSDFETLHDPDFEICEDSNQNSILQHLALFKIDLEAVFDQPTNSLSHTHICNLLLDDRVTLNAPKANSLKRGPHFLISGLLLNQSTGFEIVILKSGNLYFVGELTKSWGVEGSKKTKKSVISYRAWWQFDKVQPLDKWECHIRACWVYGAWWLYKRVFFDFVAAIFHVRGGRWNLKLSKLLIIYVQMNIIWGIWKNLSKIITRWLALF